MFVPRDKVPGAAAPHGHVVVTPRDGSAAIVLDTWQCCHCGRHCLREPGRYVRQRLQIMGIRVDDPRLKVIKEPRKCWKCQRPVCDRRECQDHAVADAAGTIHTPLEGFSGPGVSW